MLREANLLFFGGLDMEQERVWREQIWNTLYRGVVCAGRDGGVDVRSDAL